MTPLRPSKNLVVVAALTLVYVIAGKLGLVGAAAGGVGRESRGEAGVGPLCTESSCGREPRGEARGRAVAAAARRGEPGGVRRLAADRHPGLPARFVVRPDACLGGVSIRPARDGDSRLRPLDAGPLGYAAGPRALWQGVAERVAPLASDLHGRDLRAGAGLRRPHLRTRTGRAGTQAHRGRPA